MDAPEPFAPHDELSKIRLRIALLALPLERHGLDAFEVATYAENAATGEVEAERVPSVELRLLAISLDRTPTVAALILGALALTKAARHGQSGEGD